jgi:hypothetical protein
VRTYCDRERMDLKISAVLQSSRPISIRKSGFSNAIYLFQYLYRSEYKFKNVCMYVDQMVWIELVWLRIGTDGRFL